MNTDEIVQALKWLAKVRTYCDTHMVNCRECEFHGFCTDPDSDESIGEQAEWMNKAASLIESLQAQLAASQPENEPLVRCGECESYLATTGKCYCGEYNMPSVKENHYCGYGRRKPERSEG